MKKNVLISLGIAAFILLVVLIGFSIDEKPNDFFYFCCGFFNCLFFYRI